MKKLSLAVLMCTCVMSQAWAQRDFSAVQIITHEVGGNIYMLEGSGGNIGVSVGSDGVLIVDNQYAPLADKIKAALGQLDSGELKFVLNTHHHGDHTGGNVIFGQMATIVAHENVHGRVSTGDNAIKKSGWPVITYSTSASVHFNGEEIQLMHYSRGHTDGDGIVYFTGSNVVHMGDTFFNGQFPYVDLGSNGNVAGLINIISHVLTRIPPDITIIPGHGAIGNKSDLKTYFSMLMETTDLVRGHMAEGKTLDQIKAAGFPEKFEAMGEGFVTEERWIETIYNSYSAE